MLSFGYTLLMYDIYTALSNEGLHPYFGFLHALKNHHPALASDLMEEWRAVLVDAMVLSLVSHHEVWTEHFAAMKEDEPGIILTIAMWRGSTPIAVRSPIRRGSMHRHCLRKMRRCMSRLR